jgi:hypothetical protein
MRRWLVRGRTAGDCSEGVHCRLSVPDTRLIFLGELCSALEPRKVDCFEGISHGGFTASGCASVITDYVTDCLCNLRVVRKCRATAHAVACLAFCGAVADMSEPESCACRTAGGAGGAAAAGLDPLVTLHPVVPPHTLIELPILANRHQTNPSVRWAVCPSVRMYVCMHALRTIDNRHRKAVPVIEVYRLHEHLYQRGKNCVVGKSCR